MSLHQNLKGKTIAQNPNHYIQIHYQNIPIAFDSLKGSYHSICLTHSILEKENVSQFIRSRSSMANIISPEWNSSGCEALTLKLRVITIQISGLIGKV